MPVLEWREVARADLLAIVDYISDDNPDAAQRLKDDIEAKAENLLEHPMLYRAGRFSGQRARYHAALTRGCCPLPGIRSRVADSH